MATSNRVAAEPGNRPPTPKPVVVSKPISNREAAEPINRPKPVAAVPSKPVAVGKPPNTNRVAAEPINKPKSAAETARTAAPVRATNTNRVGAEPGNAPRLAAPVKKVPVTQIKAVPPKTGQGPNPAQEPLSRREAAEPVYATPVRVGSSAGVSAAPPGQSGVSRATQAVQERAVMMRNEIQDQIDQGTGPSVANRRAPGSGGSLRRVGLATPEDLEVILKREERGQQETGGKYFNPQLVEAAAQKYYEHQMKIDKELRGKIHELDVLALSDKAEDKLKATQLLDSPALKKLVEEYKRINGVEGEATEGSAVKFWAGYERMRVRQGTITAQTFNKAAKDQQIMMAYAAGNPILAQQIISQPYKPVSYGQVQERYEDANGALRTRWRPATAQERLEIMRADVQARYRTAYTAKVEAFNANSQRMARYGEDFMGDDTREAMAYATLTAHQTALGLADKDLQGIDAAKNIERVVDSAMIEWDRLHKQQFIQGATERKGYGDAMAGWEKSRAQYEKSLFDAYHTKRRDALQLAFALPGVREVTAGLGAVAGGPLAVYRGWTSEMGEFQTPDIDITKFDITKGGNISGMVSAKPGTFLGFGMDTSEATKARLKQEKADFDKRLAEAVARGDWTSAAEEVGNYGSDPFGGSVGNVFANTVLDVTNVIPINVLKYPARAQKAIEAAKAGKSLLKAPVLATKGFLSPDTVLRRGEFITPELRHLAEQAAGPNPVSERVIAQRIRDEIAVVPKSQRAIALEQKIEFFGLTKSPIDAQQLRSLASERIEARAVAKNVPRQTRVERQSVSRAQREANTAAGLAARDTSDKAREWKVIARDSAEAARTQVHREAAALTRKNQEAVALPGSWIDTHAGLSEEAWLRARETNLLGMMKNPRISAPVKTKVAGELNDIQNAIVRVEMFDPEKVKIRQAMQADVAGESAVHVHLDDALPYVEPRRIAYAVTDPKQIDIEQARDYRSRALAPSTVVDRGVSGTFVYSDFVRIEADVAEAKRLLLGKHEGQFKTGRRGGASKVPTDTDPELVAAKKRIIEAAGYTIPQYDEARQVLSTAMVKANTTRGLLVSSGGGQKAMMAAREALVPDRARWLLKDVASGPHMAGATPDEIFEEFRQRYTFEGTRADPQVTSPFQQRTLEAAFEELTGTPIYHPDVAKTLDTGVLAPTFADKASYADYMRDLGEWSPQQTKTFMEGTDVWSIADEAAFFQARYGRVPPWADGQLLRDRGFFDNPEAYQDIQREIGGFNAELQTLGLTGEELRKATAYGAGVKESADWFAARKFAIQRYGTLVSPDGETLTAIPWLMNRAEYTRYAADLQSRGIKLGRGLQDPKYLDPLEKAIEKAIDAHWAKIEALPPGAIFDSNMFVEVAQDIVNDLMASKDWLGLLSRERGTLQHRLLTTYSSLVRASVVYSFAFLTINVPDTMIKSTYFRLTGRAIMSNAGEKAREWATKIVSPDFSSFYEKSSRRGFRRAMKPVHAIDRPVGVVEGLLSLPAEAGGILEVNRKRSLAARIWQSAYDDFRPRVGTDEIAEALAAKWAKKEIGRMFPSMDGAGPVAKLLNEFAPFLNYQFKNTVLWLGEAAVHPALYMRAQELGGVVEEWNRQQWIKENPWDEDGSSMPQKRKGKIPLPGAPDVYFDPTSLTDISRGLKLLSGKEKTAVDHLASVFRFVSPAPQAIFRGILDGWKVGGDYKWETLTNSEGFPTGGMRRVYVPLGEPWSGDPVGLDSVFWPLDLFNSINEKGKDGSLDTGDIYQLLGKLTMYSEFSRSDPVEFEAAYYVELKGKDPTAAAKFLKEHPNILEYWRSKAKPKSSFFPADMQDFRKPFDPERDWWQVKGKDFLEKVGNQRDHRRAVDADFERRIGDIIDVAGPFDPRIQELRDQQRFAYLKNTTQDMIEADVLSARPADWARKLTQFETDEKIAEFHRMGNMIPKRENFRSDEQFQTAMDAWTLQRATYLKAHPTVAAVLGSGRTEVEVALDAQREDWGRIFTTGRERTAKAVYAKAHGGEDPDLLYAINELSYMRLEQDIPVFYHTPREIDAMTKGNAALAMIGAAPAKLGAAVRATVLPDYAQNKWNKADAAERAEITKEIAQKKADKAYGDAIGKIVADSKVNGIMDPAKFTAGVLAAPKSVQDAYFKAHPGKKEEWLATEAYNKKISAWSAAMTAKDFDKADKIWATLTAAERNRYFQITPHGSEDMLGVGGQKTSQTVKGAARTKQAEYRAIIGPWGKAAAAKNYAEADRLWARMPQWAKDKYFADPKEGPKRIADYNYGQAMKKWTSYIGAGNWAAANKYFDGLPQWMQDRYKAKHPDSGRRYRGQQSSAFAAAMGKWVSYLEKDDFAGAKKYFDSLPDSIKNRYYNDPEKGAERRAQRDYGNAMAGWIDLIEKGDEDGARAYFDKLPKWVKDKYYGDPEKGAERKQTRDYIGYMQKWSAYMEKDDFDGAEKYFDSIPKWAQDRYYNDPEKGAERKQTKAYGEALQHWGELIGAEKFDEAEKAFDALPQWMKDRYYNDPEKGAERRQTKQYGDVMEQYSKLLEEGKFDQARDYLDTRPQWVVDRYLNDPEKGAERRQNRQYVDVMGQWGELLKKSDKTEAEAYFESMPKWVKDKYYADPEKGAERRLTRDYSKALDPWIAKLDSKDFNGAKAYFDSMPLGYRQMYFAKHPDKRGPGDTYLYGGKGTGGAAKPFVSRAPTAASVRAARAPAPPARTPYVKPTPVKQPKFTKPKPDKPTYPQMDAGKADPDFVDLAKLDSFFKLDMGAQADYLGKNPDIAQYLSNATSDDQRYRFAVLNGLRAIPKDEPWLRRIYQERYPDVFSKEAVAEYRRQKTYKDLAEHPEFQPAYEKFYNAINATYAESLHRHGVRPRVEFKRRAAYLRRRGEEGRPAKWTSNRP